MADLRTLEPERLPAADAILCCETLEHIPFAEVPGILRRLAATRVPFLVLSVPFEGTQLGFSAYLNRHTARKLSFFRKFRFLKTFRPESATDPAAHQWEVGYRGFSLRRLRETVAQAGWAPERQEFTAGCRSVFLVGRNQGV
ncbi:MAG: hypothetical protein EXQ96_04115 [Alphaproteobacteria bacterium]|nr:hypothetical protein [Alphaproteobacteria bacterium]